PRFRRPQLARARAPTLGVDEQQLPLVDQLVGGFEGLVVAVAAADREDAADALRDRPPAAGGDPVEDDRRQRDDEAGEVIGPPRPLARRLVELVEVLRRAVVEVLLWLHVRHRQGRAAQSPSRFLLDRSGGVTDRRRDPTNGGS